MKDTHSTRGFRFSPARIATAAAAAAALTASLALIGQSAASSLAAARVSGGVALVAGAQPDSGFPCSGPEYCNVG